MSLIHLADNRILNTDDIAESWDERTDWDGNNHISCATGSQWDHERLHVTAKGTFVVEHWSQWQGRGGGHYAINDSDAALWLVRNGDDLPATLEDAAWELMV
jgi:hypothetical protein